MEEEEEEEEARVPVGCSSPARARQRKDDTAERKDGRILDCFSRRQIGRRIYGELVLAAMEEDGVGGTTGTWRLGRGGGGGVATAAAAEGRRVRRRRDGGGARRLCFFRRVLDCLSASSLRPPEALAQ
jgi:hypothetical protein